MGTLTTDTINVLNNIGVANADAIAPLTDMIGLIGDAAGVAGGISSVVGIVQGWLGTDKLSQIVAALAAIGTEIQNGFHQLAADNGASQILDRNRQLNSILAGPKTQYHDDLPTVIGQQLSLDEIKSYVDPCETALNELDGSAQPDIVWNLVFDWKVFWTDIGLFRNPCYHYPYTITGDPGYVAQAPTQGLNGYVLAPEKSSDGTVFNYTYSLPAYLSALWMFLAVAGSLDPQFPQSRLPALTSAAQLLTNRYNQIITNGQGLTTLSPPNWTAAGLVQTACPPGSASSCGIRLIYKEPVNPTFVQILGALIEYGAVEKYSGYSSVADSYQVNFNNAADQFDPAILNKLQLRLLKRTKDVYVGVGLQNVFHAINRLNELTGNAPLSSSTFTWQDGSSIDLAHWSLRQVIRLAKLAPAASGYSLRALANFIVQTQPFDTPYTNAPPGVTLSLIGLLTNFPN